MKKLLVLGLMLCALLAPVEASATIALVSNYFNSNANSTTVVSGSISTTGASLIVVTCTSAYTISSVSNSGTADSWNLLADYGGSNVGYTRMAYAYAPTTSSSQTFTCTFSSSASQHYNTITVLAVSGTMTTSGVLRTSVGLNDSGSTSVSPGSITPSIVGELIVSSAIGADSISELCTSVTTPTSFTSLGNICGANAVYNPAAAGYYIPSSTSTVTPTWVFNNAAGAHAASEMAAFCPASGCTAPSYGFPGFIRSSLDFDFDPYNLWKFQGEHHAA
jgi:hypothetical protein